MVVSSVCDPWESPFLQVEIKLEDLGAEDGPEPDNDPTQGATSVGEMAEKLDIMLELVFRYLDIRCACPAGIDGVHAIEKELSDPGMETATNPPPPALRRRRSSSGGGSKSRSREHMFALTLGVFERSILATHQSKFTQFVMFYICRIGSSFCDAFVGRLINHIRSPRAAAGLRVNCAAYLGSFLARAGFVDDTTVCVKP